MDIAIKRKPWYQRYLIWIIGGALFIGVVLFLLCSNPIGKMHVNRLTLSIATVEHAPFNDYMYIEGSVKPGEIVRVTALEGGVVQRILIPEGSMVRKGDIILELQNQNLNQQILDCEAQLAEKVNFLRNTQITMEQEKLALQQELLTIRAEVLRKERAYKLYKSLYEEGLGSREEYLQASEDIELAKGRLALIENRQRQDSLYRSIQMAQMEESLQNMQLNLSIVRGRMDNLKIRAPRDGQLGQLGLSNGENIHIGQNIFSGTSVGQVNILNDYCIEAAVDEHFIDRVSIGLQGTFTRQNQKYAVSLSKIYPEVRNGYFRCELKFEEAHPENIRVGQSYYISLELGIPQEGILLKKGGFYASSGGKWVFVLNEDGTEAVRRQVKIGRQNPQYYEVLEGLSPGEQVIISSYEQFGDKEMIILE